MKEMETVKNGVGIRWENISLRDVIIDLASGGRPKGGAVEKGIFSIGAEHLDGKGGLDLSNGKFIPLEYYNSIGKGKIKANDILLVKDGATTGKVSFVSENFPLQDAAINEHVFRIELDNTKVFPKYCFYYLVSEAGQTNILSDFRGATVGGISKAILDKIQIPLPPLPIQKRIAEILDAADALKRKDQELVKKYDELAQAIFIDMFGDPVKNEKGWEVKTIEQLVKKEKHSIKRGPFGGALKKEIFVNDGYLVYEQFHALNNDFTFGRYYINQEKYDELIAFDVKPRDIIISCSGIYLGKLAIVPEGVKAGIINQALLKLTLDENIYKNDFFVKVFTQENFKETYFASERGAAIPNFPPMSSFKEFKFICPPIKIQNEYLSLVKNLQNQINLVSKEQNTTENLFQTLIQKAFKGELV